LIFSSLPPNFFEEKSTSTTEKIDVHKSFFLFLLLPKKSWKKGGTFFLKGFTFVFHQKIKKLKIIKIKKTRQEIEDRKKEILFLFLMKIPILISWEDYSKAPSPRTGPFPQNVWTLASVLRGFRKLKFRSR
jgi:hypothetical protein